MQPPPANIQLRRAQLVLMLAVLLPTLLMIVLGIILLVMNVSSATIALGVLILTGCATGLTGYILVSIYVGKGASLAQVQNDFVSSVSHELRTPITSIRLLIEALATDRLSVEEKPKVLSLLAQETERLESLVSRVLELSRVETASTLRREALPIKALIDEALSAFAAATLTQPTTVDVSIQHAKLTIIGDRSMLVRALLNLLLNAWKYTGPNKELRLRAYSHHRWVVISVEDNGQGVSREESREIFEQFTRGRAAGAGGAAGVGLGLALVRAIVRAHRGKIEVGSSTLGGAEFRLYLPRKARRTKPEAKA